MRAALAQARRASGRTFPNPPVGAIVFRGDAVLGRGHTRPVGGAHAEVVAIESALRAHGERAVRGASLAVTLEPCSHVGRTPPCADRVIEAGIARVFAGHRDPHPAVAGRGAARLRRAGVRVEVEPGERSLKSQMRHAGKLGARYVVLLGEDEMASGRVTVRDMAERRDLRQVAALEGSAEELRAALRSQADAGTGMVTQA